MTDYYKCEQCGKVFDEWEMNYKYASEHGKCLCSVCILKEAERPIDYRDALRALKTIEEEKSCGL